MAIDFNNAEAQRDGGLIPEGTITPVHMTVRPGNAGEGGWLKRSKAGDSMALDVEFTVVEGPFAKRKFWGLFTLEGTTEGHQKAADISASRMRAILESARGIRPDDESETAKAGRRMNSAGRFRRASLHCQDRIEKAKEGTNFKGQERPQAAVTPDRKAWVKVEQVKTATPAASLAPIGVAAAAVAEKAGNGVKKPSVGQADGGRGQQAARSRLSGWRKATRSPSMQRDVIGEHGINGRSMISSLNELEWGWIACAAVFAWIRTRSEQAVAEGVGYDQAIRAMPGRVPQPWDAGAVTAILPALGELQGIDWDKPIGDWSKDQMVSFIWQSHCLVEQALSYVRDEGAECKITVDAVRSAQGRA